MSVSNPSLKMLGDTRAMLQPDQMWKCAGAGIPIQASAKGLTRKHPIREVVSTLSIITQCHTLKPSIISISHEMPEKIHSAPRQESTMKGSFKILSIHLKENGLFNEPCKSICFISSQPLPQVALGMLQITEHKIPVLHNTSFPLYCFQCRFTITLTSKPRTLLLYSKQRGFLPLPLTTIQCLL